MIRGGKLIQTKEENLTHLVFKCTTYIGLKIMAVCMQSLNTQAAEALETRKTCCQDHIMISN